MSDERPFAFEAFLPEHSTVDPEDKSDPPSISAHVVCMADVEPEEVAWLWRGRIPLGMITMLDGDPGLGKSLVTVDLAARITAGSPMPLEVERCKPAAVLFVSSEDHLSMTLRPRLEAAGADLSRVHAVTAIPQPGDEDAPPMLSPEGIRALEEAIVHFGVRLVIIDPLNNHLPPGVDPFKDHEIRRVLRPLADVAARTGAAIAIVRHLRKGEGAAVQRGAGSMGIIGASRSALLVAKDPADDSGRMLASTKSNVAALAVTVRFRTVGAGPDASVGRIEWGAVAPGVTADDLASTATPTGTSELGRAADALRELLADGPRSAAEASTLLKTAGFSSPTIRRAMAQIGVVAERQRDSNGRTSGWVWSLPDDGAA